MFASYGQGNRSTASIGREIMQAGAEERAAQRREDHVCEWIVRRITDKAFGVEAGGADLTWLPRSQVQVIDADGDKVQGIKRNVVAAGKTAKLVIPGWLMATKGLI